MTFFLFGFRRENFVSIASFLCKNYLKSFCFIQLKLLYSSDSLYSPIPKIALLTPPPFVLKSFFYNLINMVIFGIKFLNCVKGPPLPRPALTVTGFNIQLFNVSGNGYKRPFDSFNHSANSNGSSFSISF